MRADVGIGPYGGLQGVQWAGDRKGRPYESVTWGAVGGPSGKSAKRCQWQRKRAGFEEVPRLAATTVAGNRLARRWATAGPYGGLQEVQWAGDRKGRPYGVFTDRIS